MPFIADALRRFENSGASEARAIAECISGALEDVEPDEQVSVAAAMAEEFAGWAESLKQMLALPGGLAYCAPCGENGRETFASFIIHGEPFCGSCKRCHDEDTSHKCTAPGVPLPAQFVSVWDGETVLTSDCVISKFGSFECTGKTYHDAPHVQEIEMIDIEGIGSLDEVYIEYGGQTYRTFFNEDTGKAVIDGETQED